MKGKAFLLVVIAIAVFLLQQQLSSSFNEFCPSCGMYENIDAIKAQAWANYWKKVIDCYINLVEGTSDAWIYGTCSYGISKCYEDWGPEDGEYWIVTVDAEKGDTIETHCTALFAQPTTDIAVQIEGPDGSGMCGLNCWQSVTAWATGQYNISFFPKVYDRWTVCAAVYYAQPKCAGGDHYFLPY